MIPGGPPHSRITARRPVGNAADQRVLHIVQGEQHISDDPTLVLITLLGSCVSACLRDERAGVGGMNHFLLPGDIDGKWSGESERSAVHAMELLVNGLLNRGASRNRLEAKIFGGARTMKGFADVGALNAEFAVSFLQRERITIVGSCIGGAAGRRVQYWPVSGRARRSFMDQQVTNTPTIPKPAPSLADAGCLELF